MGGHQPFSSMFFPQTSGHSTAGIPYLYIIIPQIVFLETQFPGQALSSEKWVMTARGAHSGQEGAEGEGTLS